MLKTSLIFYLSLLTLTCLAQVKLKNFDVWTVKAIDTSSFNTLTTFETQMDSLLNAQRTEQLRTLLGGNSFIEGTSQEIIDSAINNQKILASLRYKDNRSRYSFRQYKNSIELNDQTKQIDDYGSECKCTIDNDTLKIQMGIFVFGGFEFTIKVFKNIFTSHYLIDQYNLKIFKLNDRDSLSSAIQILMAHQDLNLSKSLKLRMGEQIYGYLTFQTINYLRAND